MSESNTNPTGQRNPLDSEASTLGNVSTATKSRIVNIIDKWHTPLGLDWWKIAYEFETEKVPDNTETEYAPKAINGVYECVMEVSSDWNYRTAYMTFHLPVIAELTDDELEEHFIHEAMHIYMQPLHTKKYAGDEELIATSLARMIQRLPETLSNDSSPRSQESPDVK